MLTFMTTATATATITTITITIIILLIIIELLCNIIIYAQTFSSHQEYIEAKRSSKIISNNIKMYKKTDNLKYLSNAIKHKQYMEGRYGPIMTSALTNHKNIY